MFDKGTKYASERYDKFIIITVRIKKRLPVIDSKWSAITEESCSNNAVREKIQL